MACCGNGEIEKGELKTNIFDNNANQQGNLPPKFAQLRPTERLALIIKI
jgi:hypothetical protein